MVSLSVRPITFVLIKSPQKTNIYEFKLNKVFNKNVGLQQAEIKIHLTYFVCLFFPQKVETLNLFVILNIF